MANAKRTRHAHAKEVRNRDQRAVSMRLLRTNEWRRTLVWRHVHGRPFAHGAGDDGEQPPLERGSRWRLKAIVRGASNAGGGLGGMGGRAREEPAGEERSLTSGLHEVIQVPWQRLAYF